MSRNFELLQRIGREQALYTTPAEVEPEPFAPRASEVFTAPSTLPLSLAGSELEEFTKLVQRLFLIPGNDSPRAVTFAATERGNGCSWVCAHAAEVLASQVTGSVCVVDANLRRPGLHSQFSVENQNGLSDALLNPDPVRSFARNMGRPNLWMLTSGSSPESAQNLISTERMRLRLAELRAEFDYVLVDAPALTDADDAVVLGASTDGVVLILKANNSRRESARQAMHDLETAKAKVLGAVLNQRTFPIPQSIYEKL